MANPTGDRFFSGFSVPPEDVWGAQHGVFSPDGTGRGTAFPLSSTFSTWPSSGQADHVSPFSPLDVVEQYTNSINDESSLHVPDDQDLMNSNQGCGLLLQESVEIPSPPPDILLSDTCGDASYEHSIQPFQSFTPENDTSSEGQSSVSSAMCQQQPPLHTVTADHEKVQCTWPKCSKAIKKSGLSRHINETHLRVVKGVCAHCGRAFQRIYLKNNHEVACTGG
ncbi:hypothetical protein M405DRAFT_841877 [Rhizopogon salebrosus TDB-379]|nr:hypothetical protein M405DRAFT_841877 [Rhizopogon salebrosus TDB-379]